MFKSLNEHILLQFASLVFPFFKFWPPTIDKIKVSQKLFEISQVPVRNVQTGFILFSHITLSLMGRFSVNQKNAETVNLVQSFSLRGTRELGLQLFSGSADHSTVPDDK